MTNNTQSEIMEPNLKRLHTERDLGQFLNKNAKSYEKDLKKVTQFQKAGVFNNLHNLNEVKRLILLQKKGKGRIDADKLADNTWSNELGIVGRIIRNAGREYFGFSNDQDFEVLRSRFHDQSLKKKDNYTLNRGEPTLTQRELIENWVHIQQMIRDRHDKLEDEIYGLEYVNDKQELLLQRSVINVYNTFYFNNRANIVNLKNFLHPNADLKKDNVVVWDRFGNVTIIWNERKADRIRKRKFGNEEHDADDANLRERFVQSLHYVPKEINCVDPIYVGKVLARYIERFRSDKEYVFHDSKNVEIFNKIDTFRDNIQKGMKEAVGKPYGIEDLRVGQISFLRRNNNLTQTSSRYLAVNCHHSLSENQLYCKDVSPN